MQASDPLRRGVAGSRYQISALSFRGLSGRLEWWVTSVSVSILFQIAFVIALISTGQEPWLKWLLLALAVAGMFACLWAGLAVTARRFRDRGDSPWMTLILLVPILGELWVLIVCGFLPERGRVKKRLVVRQVTRGVPDSEAVPRGDS